MFRIGALFSLLAMFAFGGLIFFTAREQSLTPGEKSLGVAALAMTFGFPVLFFGLIGLGSLFLSVVIVWYQGFRWKKSSTRYLRRG